MRSRTVKIAAGILVLGAAAGLALIGMARPDSNASNLTVAAERQAITVEAAPAELRPMARSLEVTGGLQPKFETSVRPEVTGMVAEVLVTEWVEVKQGDVLARLDTRDTEAKVQKARADLAAARADAARAAAARVKAGQDLERAERLRSEKVMSAQELDNARLARDTAAAEADAAQARVAASEEQLRQDALRLEKSVIRAPIAGTVALRRANVGDLAETYASGDPMFRIVDTRELDLVLNVPSANASWVREGLPVEFRSDTSPDRAFSGVVSHVNPQADRDSRSVRVLARVDNSDGALKPGLFVRARVQETGSPSLVCVPRLALVESRQNAGGAAIFVLSEDGTRVQRRNVRTGRESGELVQVTEGLAEGERVVTRGAFQLRDGATVRLASAAEASTTSQAVAAR